MSESAPIHRSSRMKPWLLFIESNTTGSGMLALRQARSLDVAPALLTNKPERYAGLEQFDGPVVVCDTNSPAALRDAIASALPGQPIAGVTTTSEYYITGVAALAEELGVAG